MENAAKALIMAGSILIALMVIGAATYMFGKLSDLEQEKNDAKAATNVSEYLEAFEQFDKEYLYGSEILSLANLQEDYNKSQADGLGYSVEIEVDIKIQIQREDSGYYLNKGNQKINKVAKGLEDLKSEIDDKAKIMYLRKNN